MCKNKTSSTPQQERKQSRGLFGFFSISSSKRIQAQTPTAIVTSELQQSDTSNIYEDGWTFCGLDTVKPQAGIVVKTHHKCCIH